MALHTLELTLEPATAAGPVKAPTHIGVTGSSDLEVLIQPEDLSGKVSVKLVTPVTGFDALWERVLRKFIDETSLSDTRIEINDNNATPAVVLLRLHQAYTAANAA
ncbi:malonate decarboxylase delta subunit [Rhodobacter aestuarii]|uniref:Malonate decarboxylase acyl carrier protein n=1 Tax=Rhodobacter aestuarii TaxID=453582 RepID=A0A1N7KBI9_9RHOB|nr:MULTISPECIES: malonate decarboxylase acyl carrier protein [Rhodobacter]PTV95775.1 malonate decarboxylase delta subunit [Rhodobacter aestuarii]SIS58932.1 malonate decarboxylase delta subunit [Rhodobacter aestuarii]SOC17338.1 malonate decarboxylase delta subunit [Rhodobacter sp. JA431]